MSTAEKALRNLYATAYADAYARNVFPHIVPRSAAFLGDAYEAVYGKAYDAAFASMEANGTVAVEGADVNASAYANAHAHVTIFTHAYATGYNL